MNDVTTSSTDFVMVGLYKNYIVRVIYFKISIPRNWKLERLVLGRNQVHFQSKFLKCGARKIISFNRSVLQKWWRNFNSNFPTEEGQGKGIPAGTFLLFSHHFETIWTMHGLSTPDDRHKEGWKIKKFFRKLESLEFFYN